MPRWDATQAAARHTRASERTACPRLFPAVVWVPSQRFPPCGAPVLAPCASWRRRSAIFQVRPHARSSHGPHASPLGAAYEGQCARRAHGRAVRIVSGGTLERPWIWRGLLQIARARRCQYRAEAQSLMAMKHSH